MIIKSLVGIHIHSIHNAFAKAFSDYEEPFDLSMDDLAYMIVRRGYLPELSFGAFVDNEVVGFTLNGVGEWKGKKTAYDTGTGVIKEYRKQGIASKIFRKSLPVLKAHQVSQYLLEVIRTNTKAFDLYRNAGFKVTREFDYYVSSKDKINFPRLNLTEEYHIRETEEPDLELYQSFWDFDPSWQNSIESIRRKKDHMTILEMIRQDEIVGYGIIESQTGDIPQFAIAPSFRQKGLGSILFKQLIQLTKAHEIQLINIDPVCTAFKRLMLRFGFSPGFGQYEMVLEL